MGGKSTLQGAVLGSKQGSRSGVDLHSWQGLTEVLRLGKESLKDPSAYAAFRNLVLEYAQQGGDPELRKQIDAVIAGFNNSSTHSSTETHASSQNSNSPNRRKRNRKKKRNDIAPVRAERPPASAPNALSTLSSRRVAPSFKIPVPPEPTQPRPAAEPPPTLPVEQEKKENVIANQESGEKVSAQKKSNHDTKQVAEVSASPTPEKGEREEVKEQPSVPAQSVGSGPASQVEVKTTEQYKSRIAEIKRLVHEQIGNPATLIDAYAERGKEYMMALLSALKATGPGSPESPTAAMARLERAYEALLAVPPETEEKKSQHGQKEEIGEVPHPKDSMSEYETKKETEKEGTEKPETDGNGPHSEESLSRESNTHAQAAQTGAQNPLPKPLSKLPKVKLPVSAIQSRKEKEEEDTAIRNRRTSLSPASTLASLLVEDEEEKEKNDATRALHEIPPERVASSVHHEVEKAKHEAPEVPKPADTGYKPLNGVDPAKVAVKQSELSSPEVTGALHQLLEEWSLFKSSGLFGVGPSGAEHPLYQKLAPLSMAEVLSGRWEGSDRKITANIKEYVNAWRHEQGVAYNIQETFEHFLRRVVLRIQKRQSGQ